MFHSFLMLINVSPHYLYWQGKLQKIEEVHAPYFLAFPPGGVDVGTARERVMNHSGTRR